MKIAVLDIGTNSVIILAIDVNDSTVVSQFEQALEPRLGEDLHKTKQLSSRAVERTIRAASRLLKSTGWLKVEKVIAFGTHVLRVAQNTSLFQEKFLSRTGIPVVVLSAEQEARMSCTGSLIDLPLETKDYAVVDVGGGSTEISLYGGDDRPHTFLSIPVGAVTLTENLELEQPLPELKRQLLRTFLKDSFEQHLKDYKINTVIGSGGTATSLAMVNLRLDEFDPSRIHGAKMDPYTLNRLTENLFQKLLPI
jgi:exopolyphosphatase/guanosine-5'-triphosphate,3'-diphosphate pyrophosphatase